MWSARRLLRAAPRLRRALSTRPPLEGDAYAILGAERGSSAKDLKKAYHRLARSWHPDVSSQPDAAFVFPHISRSYEILSDAQQRHLYDFILAKRLLPLATPDRFQAFYARASAYTPEELVHMFHRTVWRACAAAATVGAAAIALRTRRVDGNSPAPRRRVRRPRLRRLRGDRDHGGAAGPGGAARDQRRERAGGPRALCGGRGAPRPAAQPSRTARAGSSRTRAPRASSAARRRRCT